MHTEIFEIEFQGPDVEEQYITFELWVRGMWIMDEVGGGEMRECLDIEEMYFDTKLHTLIQVNFINVWLMKNQDKIYEMFKERIKKYDD
jgi:predicted transcriptional regulator